MDEDNNSKANEPQQVEQQRRQSQTQIHDDDNPHPIPNQRESDKPNENTIINTEIEAEKPQPKPNETKLTPEDEHQRRLTEANENYAHYETKQAEERSVLEAKRVKLYTDSRTEAVNRGDSTFGYVQRNEFHFCEVYGPKIAIGITLLLTLASLSYFLDFLFKGTYESCNAAKKDGYTRSGVFLLKPKGYKKTPFTAWCDMKTSKGGWTTFQRREYGVVDFEKGQKEYEDGFGYTRVDHWMGLERLHYLAPENSSNELLIQVTESGRFKSAEYEGFSVADKVNKYKWETGKYRQNKSSLANQLDTENGAFFSTYDFDYDWDRFKSCSDITCAGFWWGQCSGANLNGIWGKSGKMGVHWSDTTQVITFTQMMVR